MHVWYTHATNKLHNSRHLTLSWFREKLLHFDKTIHTFYTVTLKLNSYYRVIKSPCFPTNFPNQQTLPQPMTSQHACWNKNIWSSSKIHRPLRWADHCTFFLQIFHLAWSSNYIFDPNLTMLWNEKHPRCNWVVYNCNAHKLFLPCVTQEDLKASAHRTKIT